MTNDTANEDNRHEPNRRLARHRGVRRRQHRRHSPRDRLAAAKELAASNIRVNAVAPGFIDTDMVRALSAEKFRERMESIKMGRIGTPEDVARAVLFFCSDLSSYVTGQVLGVDGGMLI